MDRDFSMSEPQDEAAFLCSQGALDLQEDPDSATGPSSAYRLPSALDHDRWSVFLTGNMVGSRSCLHRRWLTETKNDVTGLALDQEYIPFTDEPSADVSLAIQGSQMYDDGPSYEYPSVHLRRHAASYPSEPTYHALSAVVDGDRYQSPRTSLPLDMQNIPFSYEPLGDVAVPWTHYPTDPLRASPPPPRACTVMPYAPLASPSGSRDTTDSDHSRWIIPQNVYNGSKRPTSTDQHRPARPRFSVNVSVGDALEPDLLARRLAVAGEDPLAPGFSDPAGARRNRKYTVRFVFVGLPGNKPLQRNEYSTGEKSEAVQALLKRPGYERRRMTQTQPVSRIELVESVIIELQQFMKLLSEMNEPLKLHGKLVDIKHLLIVDICRPRSAAIQPILAIDPRYRHLYACV
ncbi:hypothetical protein BV20DRAFT_356555 [Pilatotrama ljubarskyi]|nr:hypothetical protein BV20DRAFT_356555 [Pilatotrama ljubarskyi]